MEAIQVLEELLSVLDMEYEQLRADFYIAKEHSDLNHCNYLLAMLIHNVEVSKKIADKMEVLDETKSKTTNG